MSRFIRSNPAFSDSTAPTLNAPAILTVPDARLRRVARPVADFDDTLRERLRALEAAMQAGPGGVGIAAPQLGMNDRLVVVDCTRARRPCRNHGRLWLVNPEIVWHSGERALGREGCLSVPDWVGMVWRSRRVRLRYHDADGQAHELEASGFEARVIQHEVDHLDGILFTDRVVSTHDLVRRMG